MLKSIIDGCMRRPGSQITKSKSPDAAPAGPEVFHRTEQVLLRVSAESAPKPFSFIFIVGASGSGTTMMTRIVSRPRDIISLGGNYLKLPHDDLRAKDLVDCFEKNHTLACDRWADFAQRAAARANLPRVLQKLLSLPVFSSVSHVVFKRSAPFYREDRYRPDLCELLEVFPEAKVLVVYRDPCASAYSSFRRGFADRLGRCAIITEEQLTYLAAQVAALDPPRYHVLNYEDSCANISAQLEELSQFLGVPHSELAAAVKTERIRADENEKWKTDLDPAAKRNLENFFSVQRRRQWEQLASCPRAAGRTSPGSAGPRPAMAVLGVKPEPASVHPKN